MTYRAQSEKKLSVVAGDILSINAGNSGKICFPSPFGNICVKVDSAGFKAKMLGDKDPSDPTLGDVINKLLQEYTVLNTAAISLPVQYETSITLPIKPDGRFEKFGLVDVDIDININL